jgi:phosphoribosyl 1,2-cyclic phosphate phosphodiesterase
MFTPPTQMGGGIVQVDPRPLTWHQSFIWQGMVIEPIPIQHGILEITGYVFGNQLAWVTDASHIPPSSLKRLQCGLDVLVLNALRHSPHRTHFNLEQAVAMAKTIGAKQTYFVHMCHDLGHRATEVTLPPGIALAFDGLRLSL